jgi:hypothetical protein
MPLTLMVPPPDPEGPSDYVIVPTSVSFIDQANPWNVLRLRFDAAYDMNRPTRNEYFMTGSSPMEHGLPHPERRIDYQQASLYGEYAFLPQFSAFLEQPVRFLNPEINDNQTGPGDLRGGFKLLGLQTHEFTGTFQFAATAPFGRPGRGLGPGHPTLEADILGNWRPFDWLLIETSFGFWMPVDDSRLGGEMFIYGFGLSYPGRSDDFWITPVLEFTGWTVVRGSEQVVYSSTSFFNQPTEGVTVVNGNFGVRAGFGCLGDVYLGYSRALTGEVWYKDLWRIELRWRY